MKPLREIILAGGAGAGQQSAAVSGCDGKRSYNSKAAALRWIKRFSQLRDVARPTSPYRCDACKKWHVGGVK